jgi:tetratricopeptide (TPR) repeat protein
VGEPTPVASRWLASWEGRFALSEFHSGRNQVAEDEWRRAIAADATPSFRPLLVATLRARASRSDPGVVAELVDPLLGSLKSDRTMRAALLAMLGDAYFEAGRFIEARARYEQSTDIYNLPKHVNFRGLLGM